MAVKKPYFPRPPRRNSRSPHLLWSCRESDSQFRDAYTCAECCKSKARFSRADPWKRAQLPIRSRGREVFAVQLHDQTALAHHEGHGPWLLRNELSTSDRRNTLPIRREDTRFLPHVDIEHVGQPGSSGPHEPEGKIVALTIPLDDSRQVVLFPVRGYFHIEHRGLGRSGFCTEHGPVRTLLPRSGAEFDALEKIDQIQFRLLVEGSLSSREG